MEEVFIKNVLVRSLALVKSCVCVYVMLCAFDISYKCCVIFLVLYRSNVETVGCLSSSSPQTALHEKR